MMKLQAQDFDDRAASTSNSPAVQRVQAFKARRHILNILLGNFSLGECLGGYLGCEQKPGAQLASEGCNCSC